MDAFSEFNQSIIKNEDNKYSEIEQAKKDINTAMKESMGTVFGQSVNLQFQKVLLYLFCKILKWYFSHTWERWMRKNFVM